MTAAFSARARPGMGVSMPLAWDALDKLKRNDQWNVRNAREHLPFESADPWRDHWGCKQTPKAAIKALGGVSPAPSAPAVPAHSRARSARA